MTELAGPDTAPNLRPGDPNPFRRFIASLSGRLTLLTLAVLIPALAATGLLLGDAYRNERRALDRQMMETARALALVVDRQIGQQEVMLQALATSPHVANGDWAAFYDQSKQAVTSPYDWVVVLDRSGQQLLNTRIPWGQKLPVTPQDDGRFSWATPSGARFRVSNLFTGRVNGSPMMVVSISVPRPDGSTVNVNLGTRVAAFAGIWGDQQLPPSWTGAIIDEDARLVSRSRDADRFLGAKLTPDLQERLRSAPVGIVESKNLEGVPSITAWSRAPEYGWTFLVAVPKAEIVSAARRSLTWGVAGGAALLALGVAFAGWMARIIARPVTSLAAKARALGRGELVAFTPTGMAETEHLAAALSDAAAAVAKHQAELQRLNASLEARVVERTRELKETTESLVQAQKLEAVGRLTGGVAHDFNNLLMAVSGNLELLARRVTDAKLSRYVDQAQQAADRGAKLTAQLLAFSAASGWSLKAIDVNDAVRTAADMLTTTLGGGVQIDVTLNADLWPAMADPTQLELVIVNLSINARDAMPEGGVITIETANVVKRAQPLQAEGPPPGDFVLISVRDNGSGMTPEVAARAFEPFFTTKGVGEGSGLGLPQVLGLAKQLGGGVELTAAPGEGCTVAVYLPRAAADVFAERRAADLPSALPQALAGLNILLADDDGDVRAVAKAMLVELGCRVTEASSGQEAIAAAESGEAFDLALLDFVMPGLNGGETAQRLRAHRPRLRVILMSGFADADALAAVWSGPLLQKPFSAARLAAQITALMAQADTATALGEAAS